MNAWELRTHVEPAPVGLAVRAADLVAPPRLQTAQPSAAERRRQQAMLRLSRDLREAEKRAEQAEQAQALTAEAFDESQRAGQRVADLLADIP